MCWDQCLQVSCQLVDILETELRSTHGTGSLTQFSVQQVFWDAALFHPTHMPKPAKASLDEQGENARDASTLKHFCICHSVLPLDVQEASQTPKVESIEPFLLPGVGGPALTAV